MNVNKHIAITVSCVVALLSYASDDYVITINGKAYEIGLDSSKTISQSDGTELKVELKLKKEIECDRHYFSFSHSSKYKASSSDLGDGIFQTTLTTPEGAMIIVQEYHNRNPSSLVDYMLKELSKEEIDYGYAYKEDDILKEAGEFRVKGKRGTTTYNNDNWIREVCAVGGKDCGILIVTAIDTKSNSKEQFLIDTFWKTLKIKKLH